MRLSYPPVRVHIWGGLGSQLYAWALLISLQEKYPRRKLIAVFHNGGVTRREPELNPYIQGIQKVFVHDYLVDSEGNFLFRLRSYLTLAVLGLFRIPMRVLGFVAGANNDVDFSKLKPWVLSLRGHYSNRKISHEVSSLIESALFPNMPNRIQSSEDAVIAVHFRLGDLLHLKSKKPLDMDALVIGIKEATKHVPEQDSTIFVCSDSIEIALSNIGKHFRGKSLVPVDLKPRETMFFLTKVPCFVGSPSKISEWVTIFRTNSGKSLVTFLPREMSTQLTIILDESSLIHYY